MPTTTPEPEWRLPYTETKNPPTPNHSTPTTQPTREPEWKLPYTEPQPFTFQRRTIHSRPATTTRTGSTDPTGPTRQQPARALRPLPPVSFIWINILIFGWALGIGIVYGCFLAIDGIFRSRHHGTSPTKYVIPLVFVIALVITLLLITHHHNNPAPSGPIFDNRRGDGGLSLYTGQLSAGGQYLDCYRFVAGCPVFGRRIRHTPSTSVR